ncbi:hypothetical protein FGO68_gene14244 [Halteria grandinella]|uniref:Lysozyme n=1 Tax=Halteria grandinella TaxID=5974 RepID=A0A8J8T0Y5_HALGN|nr:hypothetical protein FGO68_gene14244 [Halteria grandinella]
MKFTSMTLALAGLLALTLNSQIAEAQGFLGRELDSKGDKKDGKDKNEKEDDLREQRKGCNGTISGYTNTNGTYINCTYDNGTLMNFTKYEKKSSDDGKKKNQTSFVWSAANATALIKSVYTPLFTSQLISGTKKNYVIGYGHTGKDVKANQTINQTVADALLDKDLKKAFECIKDSIWKKNQAILTDYQNTALVSFAQSVNCDVIEKFSKKVVLTDATSANAFFAGLIAKADTTTSAYLTSRRAAEKALFGIV